MKRNWISFASLALSVILLAVVAWQGTAMSQLRTDLADSCQQAEELSAQVTDLQNQGVAHGWFEDAALDVRTHYVKATFLAELPGWANSTALVTIQVQNSSLRFSNGDSLELSRGGDGIFQGELKGYMDPYTPLKLVLSDGTVLYESDSMASILPVQMSLFSGDTVYNSDGQKQMYQAEWEVELTDLQGTEVQVTDTAFREYLNGELVFEGPCYTASEEHQLEGWGLPCEDGDYVELRYICKDADGLTYEFPLEGWIIQGDQAICRAPSSLWPTLVWP
jgi:hypothetical protein